MARTKMNPALQFFSGTIDEFVYRENADGSVTVAKPPRVDPDRVPTPAEAQRQEAFKEAAALCTVFQQDPALLALYQQIVKRRGPMSRLRATIIGDVLKPPILRALDLDDYHGALADRICVKATDNVGVARLTLSIEDEGSGQVLETAEKSYTAPLVPPPDAVWFYPATVAVTPGHTVKVTAAVYDLAGNKTEMTHTKVL